MKIILCTLALSLSLLYVNTAFSAILEWNRNTEADMDHYNIYSCPTANCIVVKGVNKSTVVVPQPAIGIKPTTSAVTVGAGQVAVTAVDKTGNESGLSNQAGFPVVVDVVPPANPSGLTVR